MIIQYNKNTGQIVASYPEAFSIPPKIVVRENDNIVSTPNDLDYSYLMPLDAQDFEDPRKVDNIYDFKIKGNNIEHKKYPDINLPFIKKGKIKQMLKLWGETYEVLKGLHPRIKIREAMKKEKMI